MTNSSAALQLPAFDEVEDTHDDESSDDSRVWSAADAEEFDREVEDAPTGSKRRRDGSVDSKRSRLSSPSPERVDESQSPVPGDGGAGDVSYVDVSSGATNEEQDFAALMAMQAVLQGQREHAENTEQAVMQPGAPSPAAGVPEQAQGAHRPAQMRPAPAEQGLVADQELVSATADSLMQTAESLSGKVVKQTSVGPADGDGYSNIHGDQGADHSGVQESGKILAAPKF